MARGGLRTTRFPTRPRRKRQWIRESILPTEVANGTVVALLSITESEYTGRGFGDPTIVRIKGDGLVFMDEATASAGLSQRIGLGIITIRGGSAGSANSPLTEFDESWMWWSAYHLNIPAAAAEGSIEDASHRFSFDIKAMRILKGLDNLFFVAQNPGDSVAHVFVGVSWSVLFQE